MNTPETHATPAGETNNLLACPFCGGGPSMDEDAGAYAVHCTVCGIEQRWYTGGKADAIRAWNSRRLASTGSAKIDPAWSLADRVEFALRDAGFDYDEAFRIAKLAGSAPAPGAWRPIETAPKDGRVVLLVRTGWPAYSGRWHNGDWTDAEDAIRYPEFWMPVPTLPAAPTQEPSP